MFYSSYTSATFQLEQFSFVQGSDIVIGLVLRFMLRNIRKTN